jgi:Protein of unknown function (DUF664)
VQPQDFSPSTEREALGGFLDLQRDGLIRKIEGVSDAEARSTPTASALSLLGIVKHCALWERRWFQVVVAGRRFPGEWPEVDYTGMAEDFVVGELDTVEHWVASYREQAAISREITTGLELDAPCARTDLAGGNLRWVLLHLIEETARHAGHADIIREALDGTCGQRHLARRAADHRAVNSRAPGGVQSSAESPLLGKMSPQTSR